VIEYREQRLLFRFDDSWRVLKWDDHAAFHGGLRRHQSTCGVDFFGLSYSIPTFIEVKDFRNYRIENKPRVLHGDLVDEIASKVRDTLSSAVWACGRPFHDADLALYLKQIFATPTRCDVVLWLEEDPQPRPVDRSVLGQQIKRALRWLNPRVAIASRGSSSLPGLTVTGVPPG